MSFFSEIEKVFKELFGSAKWENTASEVITVVTPLVSTILVFTAGEPAATTFNAVVLKVQNGLAAAAKVISDVSAGTKPSASAASELSTILSSIQSDLGTLLAAGQIKNPATQAKVTAIVNTIIGEVEAILQVLPKT